MSEFWPEESGENPSIIDEMHGRVAVVTLNRPDCLNAWTPAMGTRYFDTLDRLAADPAVHVILVRGAGRGFCAGADLKGLANIAASGGETPERDHRPYWHPMSIGKPVIAAIHGVCYTVGLQQALCCDVRFAARDARLSAPYAKRALVAETGIAWLLSRSMGMPRTLDFLYSGRVLSGEEALAANLVNQVCDEDGLFEAAMTYCQGIAAEGSPWALRAIKQQVYDSMMTTLAPALAQSEALLQQSLASADFAEGLRAFGEKRAPDFPGLKQELSHLDPWPGND